MEDGDMKRARILSLVAGSLLVAFSTHAQEGGVARPNLLLQQAVEGMPKGDKQEISILTATLKPGDKTVFHTHRFPVSVYILEGAFTLEMEGRQPVTVKAGESMVEPPNVKMTGYNKSATEPMKVVIFYVADPGTPFLDPLH
jgi:quercetin dioxygenase-like cupin family protein